MPIYAYRCTSCGHAKDVLQKVSDPPLTFCPACGAEAMRKQVTAAGFQLKGSGWYVTDFRGGGAAAPAATGDGKDAQDAKPVDKDAPAGAPPTTATAAPAAASSPAPAPSPSGSTPTTP